MNLETRPNPKTRAYPEKVREQAIKAYYAGASGRGVGKIFGFSKAKYWFTREKSRTETRESTYIMTAVSRMPRQIVGFDAAFEKTQEKIQAIVDAAPNSWELPFSILDFL